MTAPQHPQPLEDAALALLRLAGRDNPVGINDLAFWLRQDRHVFPPEALLRALHALAERGYVRCAGGSVVYLHEKADYEGLRNMAWSLGYYFNLDGSYLNLCCRVTDRVCQRILCNHRVAHPDELVILLGKVGIHPTL